MLCKPSDVRRATGVVLWRGSEEIESDETDARLDVVCVGGDAFLERRASFIGSDPRRPAFASGCVSFGAK